MSYIKKEPLLQIVKEIQGKVFGAPLIVRAIENAPEEDVSKIVRCKYCQHSEYDDYHGNYYCRKLRSWCNGEFYCAYGEENKQ